MKLAGDILILIMMLLSNGRVLVIRKPHQDPLVMLAPFSFLLASLSLFAFSIDVFSVLILFLSILVLLSNFHALFRYGARLIVDRYSLLMKTWALLTTTLCAATLGALLIFAPAGSISKKTASDSTIENQYLYSGDFSKGFWDAEKFSIANAFLYEFTINGNSNENSAAPDSIILFMPDKRGDTISYKPFLSELAQASEQTVCSFDFFTRDMKWIHSFEDSKMCRKFGLIIRSIINPGKFNSQKEFYTYNYTKEFDAAIKICQKKYGKDTKFYLVTDETGFTAAHDTKLLKPELITGIFDLSTISDYKTPGYGFIDYTDPLLAAFLGNDKDTERTSADICAKITAASLKSLSSN